MKNLKDLKPAEDSKSTENEKIQTHIFIAQEKLRPWFGKIDSTDAIIIVYIVNWRQSGNAESRFSEGEEYIWIDYKHLLQQLPILNIAYETLKDRLDKIYSIGIFDRKIFYRSNRSKATFYLVPDELLKKNKKAEDDKKTENEL